MNWGITQTGLKCNIYQNYIDEVLKTMKGAHTELLFANTVTLKVKKLDVERG